MGPSSSQRTSSFSRLARPLAPRSPRRSHAVTSPKLSASFSTRKKAALSVASGLVVVVAAAAGLFAGGGSASSSSSSSSLLLLL